MFIRNAPYVINIHEEKNLVVEKTFDVTAIV